MRSHLFNVNQAIFRLRLFYIQQQFLERRLIAVKEKQERAKAEWDAYLAKCKEWQMTCHMATCRGCGENHSCCRCHYKTMLDELVLMIRRLARINPLHGVTKYIHDEDRSDGPAGYRVCGKNSWDNAVRAVEEDR